MRARSDFLWRVRLRVEQDEEETMRGYNKVLLENILPAHVAQHFLTSGSVTEVRFTLTIHILDRQTEVRARFNFLWRVRQ